MRYYRNYGAKNINLAPIDDLVKVLPTQEQTGEIVTFDSPFAGLPLKSHKIALTATQSGSGTPSPDNVRTINGYSAIGVSATGKNLWGGEGMLHSFQRLNMEGFSYNDEKLTFQANPSYGGYVLISNCFKPNTQYTVVLTGYNTVGNQPNLVVNYADGRQRFIQFPNSSATKQTAIYTSLEGSTIKDISRIFYGGATTLYYNECALLEGIKTADDFVPYGTYTKITIGSTVYGGEYDARTGILTVTHGRIDLGSVTWNRYTNSYKTYFRTNSEIPLCKPNTSVNRTHGLTCSIYLEGAWGKVVDSSGYDNQFALGWGNKSYIAIHDDSKSSLSADDFKTAMSGETLVFPLATPQTIQLPPCPIDTLEGVNNIWADTGDTTVQYFKK